MRRRQASAVGLFAGLLVALAPAAAGAAGPLIPVQGHYTGTAAGEPFSMRVSTKKTGPKLRAKGINRTAETHFVEAAIPISCDSGASRSEDIRFPGPLGIRRGRFRATAFSKSTVKSNWGTMRIIGRFTTRRKVSGTLTTRSAWAGEYCAGSTTWTATRG